MKNNIFLELLGRFRFRLQERAKREKLRFMCDIQRLAYSTRVIA